MKSLKVHIIGGRGNMGNWLKNFLESQKINVAVSGREDSAQAEIKKADIVVVSAPISKAPEIILDTAEKIKPGALIVDMSSIKKDTAKALEQTKKPALAMHLLFGPTVSSVVNQKIVFSVIKKSEHINLLKHLFQNSGAVVIEMSAKDHDDQMLHIQALTHFVNLSLAKVLLENKIGFSGKISTPVFLAQLATINRVISQSPSLLSEIQLSEERFVDILDQLIKVENKLKRLIISRNIKDLTQEIDQIHKSIDSVKLQKVKNRITKENIEVKHLSGEVAFLGPKGTFSHQVGLKVSKKKSLISCSTIGEVFEAVKSDRAKFGIVPAENSIEGTVRETLDLLINHELKTLTSISLPIHQNLMSFENSLDKIQKVISHPQALAQCREWLKDNLEGAILESASSTISPIQIDENKSGVGFICSEVAAKLYKLNVLARNIEDLQQNVTKFYIISKDGQLGLNSQKTLLFLTVFNRVGILRDILAVIADLGINLSKLESRPSKEKNWDYCFFMELEVTKDDPKLIQALNMLKQYCPQIKILGGV